MRSVWLCHSGIVLSETFLRSTIDLLASLGPSLAISGALRPSSGDGLDDVRYLGFADLRETMLEKVAKRGLGQNAFARRLQSCCDKRCRNTINAFKPQVIWVDYASTAVMAEKLLRRIGVPYVIAVHGYDVSGLFCDPHYVACFDRVARGAAAIVCASHHIKRLVVMAGVPEAKVRMVRLALDSTLIRPDPAIEKTRFPSFVHFGRLADQKHPIATLYAFSLVHREMPNARLTFIGDGPLRESLELHTSLLKLQPAVEVLGAMPREAALPLVQEKWVFCQHSVTGISGCQEGFALSPAEAALLELPVVSTLHNGIPEHVLDGVTGYLVREFDYESMASKMLYLARDANLRQTMGRAGRLNVKLLCDPETRRQHLASLLQAVAS